ncbi:hypothetical protein B0H10DRAFT_1953575 [Mycena sp. CBHHK59/15]|nr:hypothetical protein B0H10DRAFT_1953575 [Mycena sp. CBHHK59/15]
MSTLPEGIISSIGPNIILWYHAVVPVVLSRFLHSSHGKVWKPLAHTHKQPLSIDLSLTSVMSTYCDIPFHPDPGYDPMKSSPHVWLAASQTCCPPGLGMYKSWESCKAAAEGMTGGSSMVYPSYEACLPAWHARCSLGEHAHAAPVPLTTSQSSPHRHLHQGADSLQSSLCVPLLWIPDDNGPPTSSPPSLSSPSSMGGDFATADINPMEHYTVRGGCVVYSCLTDTIIHYQAAVAHDGQVEMCTSTDLLITNYFTAGDTYQDTQVKAVAEHGQTERVKVRQAAMVTVLQDRWYWWYGHLVVKDSWWGGMVSVNRRTSTHCNMANKKNRAPTKKSMPAAPKAKGGCKGGHPRKSNTSSTTQPTKPDQAPTHHSGHWKHCPSVLLVVSKGNESNNDDDDNCNGNDDAEQENPDGLSAEELVEIATDQDANENEDDLDLLIDPNTSLTKRRMTCHLSHQAPDTHNLAQATQEHAAYLLQAPDTRDIAQAARGRAAHLSPHLSLHQSLWQGCLPTTNCANVPEACRDAGGFIVLG